MMKNLSSSKAQNRKANKIEKEGKNKKNSDIIIQIEKEGEISKYIFWTVKDIETAN